MTFSTVELKQRIDLRDLAGKYTSLEKWTASELAGPCPKCGGEDRFHVKPDWWYCNQCYPFDNGKPHDAIAFVQWLDGVDFKTACERLDGGYFPTRPQPKQKRKEPKAWLVSEDWQREASQIVEWGAKKLQTGEGRPVREYLEKRGLRTETWQAFKLGAYYWTMPISRCKGLAVVMPWLIGKRICGVKFRFVNAVEEHDRFSSKGGSEMLLFGLQNVNGADTLILVEGEFNAMSLWQTAKELGIQADVVSFGSEAGAHDSAVKLARHYKRVFVWADKGEVAANLARRIGDKARGLKSPRGLDANDMLQRGLLADFMKRLLERQRRWRTVTVLLPAGCPLGVPPDRYELLPTGEIRATYTPDELWWALRIQEQAEKNMRARQEGVGEVNGF